MGIQYVAFDVETPNRYHNRICSIGITTIDEKWHLETTETLIDPECQFDYSNSSITGITADSVRHAPVFPEVWKRIKPLFTGAVIVAHNASFDLCVLQKTLAAYGLDGFVVNYLCTYNSAQAALPSLGSHKLSAMCDYYGIPLEHHHAGSDSRACAIILRNLCAAGFNAQRMISQFDLSRPVYTEETTHWTQTLSKTTQALNEMNHILQDISEDGILTVDEINLLINWMNANIELKGNFPYDRIYNKLAEVLEDGVITAQEHNELIQLFQTATNPVETTSCTCEVNDLTGKNICLSGEFDYGSKEEVSALLTGKGAIMQNGVTRKTDILVVGGQGSSAWASGNYGTKIKKALELQTKGISILIVREADFFDSI